MYDPKCSNSFCLNWQISKDGFDVIVNEVWFCAYTGIAPLTLWKRPTHQLTSAWWAQSRPKLAKRQLHHAENVVRKLAS